jgi:redox-sensitive bicupin YhaK (pirin superfamily)
MSSAGGMVWTQAGSGLVHEEMAAKPDGDMHMVQMFVNLPRDGKLAPPRVYHLDRDEVPEWRGGAGDRVRVLAGSFDGKSSPLAPAQPFRFLDAWLRSDISFGLADAHNAVVYVMSGAVAVRAEGGERRLAAGHAVAMGGDGTSVTLTASEAAHMLVLSGAEIREPVVASGPFIMTTGPRSTMPSRGTAPAAWGSSPGNQQRAARPESGTGRPCEIFDRFPGPDLILPVGVEDENFAADPIDYLGLG